MSAAVKHLAEAAIQLDTLCEVYADRSVAYVGGRTEGKPGSLAANECAELAAQLELANDRLLSAARAVARLS